MMEKKREKQKQEAENNLMSYKSEKKLCEDAHGCTLSGEHKPDQGGFFKMMLQPKLVKVLDWFLCDFSELTFLFISYHQS